MGTADFRASYHGVGEMLRSPWMQAEMRRRAEKVKAAAEAIAPVGDPAYDRHAGRYKASFVVESGSRGGFKRDRAYGKVTNSAPYAIWVEKGNSRTPAHHVLRRALKAAEE